ncbi:MAG: dockerin type I domain-containing protein [Firmicutes bacterium]|nr:dockerin type I domain-containing protein [Bacillota bacterium]
MKNTGKRLLAAVLAVVMLASLSFVAFAAQGDDDEFKVVVSMEGLTLGQGLYFEPQVYTLSEINALLETEGYGPLDRSEVTAGLATLAFFIDHNIDYTMTGNWTDTAYVSSIKNVDKGYLDIPSVITENGGPSNDENDGNNDEYLGEFDYDSMSGWMITVNDFMINVGCAGWYLENEEQKALCPSDLGNTYVVRWQFTLHGYGADLGVDTGWGMPSFFEGAKKAELYAAYANCSDAAKKAQVMPVMENLTATQDEVDAAVAILTAGDTGDKADYKTTLNETMAQLAATVTEPSFGTGAGEWTVLSLARGNYYDTGDKYFEDYYSRIEETVKEKAASVNLNGALHKVKSTENSRLIMALSAIGKDPTKVGGVDLVGAYSANGFSWIKKQGLNGPVFALIALDTYNYKTSDATIRQQCVDYILQAELANGGWALSGTTADPDMTAMALQALADYADNSDVKDAAERGFAALSSIQKDNGGYASWGSVNSESIAQVIVACTAWGIDPSTDSRFVKSGGSAVDALLEFYVPDGKGFAHVLETTGGYAGGEVNAMATDQACYALVAYDRFVNNKNALYDMSDVTHPEPAGISASISLPAEISNKKGTTFNAIVSVSDWDNEAGWKLVDATLSIPKNVTVTGVTMGSRVSGGNVMYNLDENGKLRIVYFDAENNSTIEVSGSSFPAEFFIVGLELTDDISVKNKGEITVSVDEMNLKKSSDESDDSAVTVVNTATAKATSDVVKGVSFTAKCLYVGDGVDLIPTDKMAIAIFATELENGAQISYKNGAVKLHYSRLLSEKLGVCTYVAMVPADTDLGEFANAANYTYDETETADALNFGDTNSDGVVNAQDALNAANAWLRKTDAPDDEGILRTNVTGDGRINTSDALGIVENFVNGDDFGVVAKAAA